MQQPFGTIFMYFSSTVEVKQWMEKQKSSWRTGESISEKKKIYWFLAPFCQKERENVSTYLNGMNKEGWVEWKMEWETDFLSLFYVKSFSSLMYLFSAFTFLSDICAHRIYTFPLYYIYGELFLLYSYSTCSEIIYIYCAHCTQNTQHSKREKQDEIKTNTGSKTCSFSENTWILDCFFFQGYIFLVFENRNEDGKEDYLLIHEIREPLPKMEIILQTFNSRVRVHGWIFLARD